MFYIPMSAERAYFYLSCPEEERSIYSHECLTRLLLSILSRGGTFHYRERSCGMS